jgi:hypothetical protein
LLELRLPPIFAADTVRALWRHSPADRELAARLHADGLAR